MAPAGTADGEPKQMAGLPGSGSTVWVGPPLDCGPLGSSPAAVLFRSPVAVRALEQVLSVERL